MAFMYEQYVESAEYLRERLPFLPRVGAILGSGLGIYAESLEEKTVIRYEEIPHFCRSTNESHAGELVLAKVGENPVLMMSGRFHYFEGYSLEQVVFPVRVMKLLGVETLVVTKAAGGINTSFTEGDYMLNDDYIKLVDASPTRGENLPQFGPRFFDMGNAYDRELRAKAEEVAKGLAISLRHGVYAWMGGPQFETPAEIRMLRTLGADAVGMSTVPETIAANHCGIRVLGLSCITNMAAGIKDEVLSDEDVVKTAGKVSARLVKLMDGILRGI